MDIETIVTGVLSFIAGGGILSVITLKASKKKADVEVKVDEIKALHDTIETVYQPIINQQNARIAELEDEVKQLRQQLHEERIDHQKEIDLMNKRILEITKALGMRASTQIRDEKGRFSKNETIED
jgi:Mg2+ and Co2+ transporter CorA